MSRAGADDEARPTTRSILHADLDAFFASVEQLHDPSLVGQPVIVGGLGNRGVVAAASYEARRFGVHSAMPTAHARRACPDGVFLPPRFEAYSEASRTVLEVFRSVTPLVEPLALDEAFLDVTGAHRLLGSSVEIAEVLRERVRTATGLVVSVGGATTKHLAKLASQDAKPDGVLVLAPDAEAGYLEQLPVGRLWGVGPATLVKLERLGVGTVADLARLPDGALDRAVGPGRAEHLLSLATNADDRRVETVREAKSVGHEETFARDVHSRRALHAEVVRLAELVARRLRSAGLVARTVVLKARYPDFSTITRSRTLTEPTDHAATISSVALELLDDVDVGRGLRLLGVSTSNLLERGASQETLDLDGGDDPSRRLDLALDELRDRFGEEAVGPARLAGPGGLRVQRRGSLYGPDGRR